MTRAGYPGSEMIPCRAASPSLLLLEPPDKERRSHADDFNRDEALGLFAGLDVLPKKSLLTEYSYRTTGDNQRALQAGWAIALSQLLFSRPEAFSLDFHPIPYRGEETVSELHHIPLRGKASPSVLTFFVLEQDSRVLCYATANPIRPEQAEQVICFADFWKGWRGRTRPGSTSTVGSPPTPCRPG